MEASAPRERLVYIAARGHSGSTLTEMLLGAHSRIVTGGEHLSVWRSDDGSLVRRLESSSPAFRVVISPDGALIASGSAEDYPMPQLVVAGPSFPGPHGAVVSRTGAAGQLAGLLDERDDVLGLVVDGNEDVVVPAHALSWGRTRGS